MKHRFLTFAILIVCSTYLYGQDNVLISSKHVQNSTEKANEILRRNETYTSVDFVEINVDKILDVTIQQLYVDAGIILIILPILIIYIALQKYFIEGVERSGIVG